MSEMTTQKTGSVGGGTVGNTPGNSQTNAHQKNSVPQKFKKSPHKRRKRRTDRSFTSKINHSVNFLTRNPDINFLNGPVKLSSEFSAPDVERKSLNLIQVSIPYKSEFPLSYPRNPATAKKLNFIANEENKIFVQCKIDNLSITCCLDTGASVNAMPPDIYHLLKKRNAIKSVDKNNEVEIVNASGQMMQQKAPPFLIDVVLGHFQFELTFYVLEGVSSILIGYPFCYKHLVSLIIDRDAETREITTQLRVGPEKAILGFIPCTRAGELKATPQYDFELQPGVNLVNMTAVVPDHALIAISKLVDDGAVHIEEQIMQISGSTFQLEIYNFSDANIMIYAHIPLASVRILEFCNVFTCDEKIETGVFGIPLNSKPIKKEMLAQILKGVNLGAENFQFPQETVKKQVIQEMNIKMAKNSNIPKSNVSKSNIAKDLDANLLKQIKIENEFCTRNDERCPKGPIDAKLCKNELFDSAQNFDISKNKQNITNARANQSRDEKIPIEIKTDVNECINENDPNELFGTIDEELLEPKGIDIETDRMEFGDDIWKEDIRQSNFPPDLQEKFIEVMSKTCPEVFARHSLDCGGIDPELVCINDLFLKPGAEVRVKPIKLNPIRKAQVDNILNALVKHGIIKKGPSYCYSPVFIVGKKGNRLRLVTSYCKLNRSLLKLFYSVPGVHEVIQEIGQVNDGQPFYFTVLDLSNAYSSIRVEGIAQQQMAICTTDNTYLCLRLLFGTQVAPAKFNEAIKKVLQRCQDSSTPWCFSFFDDIIIVTGKDRQEHFDKVVKVFETIGKAGFKCRADKCSYFQHEATILGRRVNRLGMMPSERHIKSIAKLQAPTNVNETQRVIGILNWHSCILPDFAKHMSPIYELLKKDAVFNWGPRQQASLDYFKQKIQSYVMTYFPDYKREAYVCTDASRLAIAGTLYQVLSLKRNPREMIDKLIAHDVSDEEVERNFPILPPSGKRCPPAFNLHSGEMEMITSTEDEIELKANKQLSKLYHVAQPIAYCSRTVTGAQRSYIALELEAMALVYAIESFTELLLGFKKVYVLTDSQPLLYMLRKAQSDNAKMSRWLMKFRQIMIEFILVHTKGQYNYIADFLSRSIFHVTYPIVNKLHRGLAAVKSPFKTGQMVTLPEIMEVLNNDPDIVYNINPKGTGKTIETETLGYFGTSFSALLQKDLQIENIIAKQKVDDFCTKIRERLGKLKTFYEYQGVIYKKTEANQSEQERGRIVIPAKLLYTLISYYHLANHCGADSLFSQIKHTYYHSRLLEATQNFCQSCYLCAIFKSHRMRQPLATLPYYPIRKCSTWSIDITAGLPVVHGYKSLLTMVEHFSHFCILHPLKKDEASEISRVIYERILCQFPLPDYIISDNAQNALVSFRPFATCMEYVSTV